MELPLPKGRVVYTYRELTDYWGPFFLAEPRFRMIPFLAEPRFRMIPKFWRYLGAA